MKPVIRFCLILLIATLVIAPVAISRAQGTACLPGLQAADCDLLTAATKGSITSTTMDYVLSVNVTGLEGVKSGSTTLHDIALNVAGNGPLSIDKSKMPAKISGSDPKSLTDLFGALTLGNAIKVDLKNGSDVQSRSFEFRIVGGKLYYMADNADMYPDSQKSLVGKWLVADPSQMQSNPGFSSAMGNVAMGSSMANPASMAQAQAMIQQFLAVPGFITAARADANNEATFTVNVDIATLLKSPQFKPILTSIAASMGGASGTKMDENQLNAMLGMVTPYFEGLKITVTDVVGTQDKLVHGFGLHIALSLTAEQLQTLGAMGGGSSGGDMPTFTNPLTADINFSIKLANLNQPVTLAAPEGATPVQTGMGSAEPAATAAQ